MYKYYNCVPLRVLTKADLLTENSITSLMTTREISRQLSLAIVEFHKRKETRNTNVSPRDEKSVPEGGILRRVSHNASRDIAGERGRSHAPKERNASRDLSQRVTEIGIPAWLSYSPCPPVAYGTRNGFPALRAGDPLIPDTVGREESRHTSRRIFVTRM